MAGGERILLVEDDDLMRELMTKILAGEHYHIFQASSGEEALKLLQEQTIDLVIDRSPADGHEWIAIAD